MYTGLKFVHVLLAIIAVGFNASYGIWLSRAGREDEHALHVLQGVKILDSRFANPAYGLLLVTGLGMVVVGELSLRTFWLAAALVLYVIALGLGAGVYTPTLRRQIAILESEGTSTPEFEQLSRRGAILGGVLGAIVVVIVFLMVVKPTL